MIDSNLLSQQVLVLGGAGFLGARILRKLCAAGCNPHLLLRSGTPLGRIEDLLPRCHVHRGDLTELDSVQRIIDEVRPNVLFHASGKGSHKGDHTRDRLFRNNLMTVNNLLVATEPFPDCRIIYSGTSLAQGKRDTPLRENGPLDPISIYAASKAAASVLVQQAACHGSHQIVILNPFSIYGPGESAGRLIPTAIRAGLDGSVLEMTESGFVRDFVYVDDVADGYLQAAVNNQVAGETLNLAGGRTVSNEEVVSLIEQQLGVSIRKKIGVYPARATDTNYWCADISKARELLGWQPVHSLREGIAETTAWYKKYGFRF